MDCTYHYYLNGQNVVEERMTGNDIPIKQLVWGLEYTDELVQVALNDDADDNNNTCTDLYWACQDANYNVRGIVDSSGTLAERYEYTAYGQRQVFVSAGSNDPGCYTPTTVSTRFYDVDYSHTEPY